MVQAIAGARRRREETYIRSQASVAKRTKAEPSSALGTWPRASRESCIWYCHIVPTPIVSMGDRAFARARAAGKNEIEAGHARAKAEADIALSLPAEYRD